MAKIYQLHREIEIEEGYDLVVAGAAAAICAARAAAHDAGDWGLRPRSCRRRRSRV